MIAIHFFMHGIEPFKGWTLAFEFKKSILIKSKIPINTL